MGNGKKIVVALGGNALQSGSGPATAEAQLEVVKNTSRYIAQIKEQGYELAIVHGNGPQVGRIVLASEAAKMVTPSMPFDVCGAMSQGYIGYHIQQALGYELQQKGITLPVVTLATQVVVDEKDPCFQNPSKPIGPFYNKEEAEKIAKETGYVMKEDSGRGYRRVVASPIPVDIVEIKPVRDLWQQAVVVACGGGGIPVIRKEDGSLEGVAAVIDKDFAAELLAELLDADILMILTEVEHTYIDFNTPTQEPVHQITASQLEKLIEEDHFAPGSMLPKVRAALKFVKGRPGKKAIITALSKGTEGLAGRTGTVVVND
jgi:carbamate kinase